VLEFYKADQITCYQMAQFDGSLIYMRRHVLRVDFLAVGFPVSTQLHRFNESEP